MSKQLTLIENNYNRSLQNSYQLLKVPLWIPDLSQCSQVPLNHSNSYEKILLNSWFYTKKFHSEPLHPLEYNSISTDVLPKSVIRVFKIKVQVSPELQHYINQAAS